LQSNPADYVESDARPVAHAKGARSSSRRAARRPRVPSTAGYLLTTAILAAAFFAGAWWLFSTGGDEPPWLPATIFASVVVVISVAAREVVVRRAWARYTHELEIDMGGGREATAVAQVSRPASHKAGVQATAASLRALQQRLSAAEEAGARQPEAHLEAYRLCEQYFANTEESIRSSRTQVDVRAALRAGQERVRESQKHHLLAWARGEAQRLTHEAQRRASVSAKIETAMRAVEVIDEALQVYPQEPELRDSAVAVRNFIASVKVAHWVELAERASFRGRYTRAIARYRDALFYLSRAEMSDEARDAAAERINREIEMLRARIATGELVEERPPRRRKTKKDEAGRANTP
jgi:hypothetical protein